MAEIKLTTCHERFQIASPIKQKLTVQTAFCSSTPTVYNSSSYSVPTAQPDLPVKLKPSIGCHRTTRKNVGRGDRLLGWREHPQSTPRPERGAAARSVPPAAPHLTQSKPGRSHQPQGSYCEKRGGTFSLQKANKANALGSDLLCFLSQVGHILKL